MATMTRVKLLVALSLLAVALVGCGEPSAPTLTPEEKAKFSQGTQESEGGKPGGAPSTPKETTAESKD
jgi:hypothetical protein